MFVKCLDAKSYINTNQVFGLFVEGNTANVADPLYYIKAGMDAECIVNYLLEGFATKAEAEAALEAIVAKLNDQQQAPAQNVVTTGECTIHKNCINPKMKSLLLLVLVNMLRRTN